MKMLLIAVAALTAATAATPAAADVSVRFGVFAGPGAVVAAPRVDAVQYRRARLPAQAVVRQLQRQGFRSIERVTYRPTNDRYVVQARRPNGNIVRVTVNARNGAILRQVIIRR